MSREIIIAAEDYQQEFEKIITFIREQKPLIHQLTNIVTVNDCAAVTLNWGALPVMAHASEEVEDMLETASTLLLNLGTLSPNRIETMLKAAELANKLKIPVVLDPVGVGASELRNEAAERIISKIDLALIKGNKAEITFLAGKTAKIKGVESLGNYAGIEITADRLARKLKTIIVVTSDTDITADGESIYKIDGGDELMGEIVGSGCMLGSTLAVFAAAAEELKIDLIDALNTAVSYYSYAGELAAKEESTPIKFKKQFMDNIYLLSHSI